MTTKAMPLLLNSDGQHLELRNAADGVVQPATQLKSGEDARAAAKRAVEEFFGFTAPEDAIREGYQARVGNEVVAIYPVDSSKMEMALLRPAEEVATWAWRDVPKSMGNVVALGFPRNIAERRNSAEGRTNGLVNVFDPSAASAPMPGHTSSPASPEEAEQQFAILQASVAAKASGLKDVPAHERHARSEELSQEIEDLRLLAADMGRQNSTVRKNSADASRGPLTARALIRQNDGTIIAARQKDGRSLLPGGHIENGETPEGAVARELQEELGLDIKSAMTGERYDFHGQDGSSHRVFVVDGGKLDLTKMTPGDDVDDAEVVNSPFTDSHGQVHPAPATDEQVDDIAEIERHAEGIAHEIGELEKKNASDSAVYAELQKVVSEIKKLEASGEDADRLAKLKTTKAGLEKEIKSAGQSKDNDAGEHNHQYPDRLNGAFPVLICSSTSEETIATQETDKLWRCEACGAEIDGPPKPELVVEGA